MSDRTVKVTLTAQVQGYIDGMQKASQATQETGSATEKLAQQKDAFERMGRTAMISGGTIAAGLGLAAKAATDWDTAWAGVTKTVDGTDSEMAELEGQLRSLTGVLPATHAEIAAVAEAAGQLGVERENVAAFTRTMIDLGETTNLSSDEAATSLARFMTVMGTAKDEVSGLGSALVDLGNNYATTEREIMEMGMRLSGAGAQIGMSEGQVLGLSTALSSVGIEAEAGGSAMSKVMIDIASSVDKGGERLDQFASVSGMSAKSFADQWRSDPGAALAAFVSGLANAEAQGKSTFGILEELGISEIRMRDALLRSASAADQFSAAMAQGDDAMSENTALAAEAEKRYETTAAQLGIMRNKVVDAAISLGSHLLPALEGIAKGIGGFADILSGLDGPMGAAVAWTGVIASGLLLAGGAYLAIIPKIAAYRVAMETLNFAGLRSNLASVARFLTGPWGVAMGAAAAGFGLFKAGMESGRSSVTELESVIKSTANSAEVLEVALSGQNGVSKFVFGDYTKELENLGDVLQDAKGYADGWVFMESFGDQEIINRIRDTGQALTAVAENDLPQAQSAFKEMANTYGLTREEAAMMLDRMPEFRDYLIQYADSVGIAATDSNLLKIAMSELGPVTNESGEAAQSAAQSYVSQADAAKAASDELRTLIDTLNEANGIGQSAEAANSAYQQSLAEVAEYIENAHAGLEGYTASLDASTAEGAKAREMFSGLAADSQKQAEAYFAQEQSTLGVEKATENYISRLQSGRQALIDQITALTGNAEAATAFADEVYKIPTEAETKIMAETAEASRAVQEFQSLEIGKKAVEIDVDNAKAFEGIQDVNVIKVDKKTAYVVGNTEDANKKIAEVIQKGIPGKTAFIDGNDDSFWVTWQRIQMANNITKTVDIITRTFSKAAKNADGGMYAYENGGFGAGIYSGGAPLYKFAEPETGWEAFISGKPSERDRNRQIWVEAGNRLGMQGAGSTQVIAYVENPFTGDYLLARTREVADGAVYDYAAERSKERRRAGL